MNSKEQMISQLPNYERDNKLINEIYRVLGDKTDDFLYKIEDLYKQMNIDTATWGLDIWEKNFGFSVSHNLTYEERRARIKTKMRGFGKVSTDTLEATIQDYYDGKVNVYFNHRLLFEIPLEGLKGKDLDKTIAVINELKPSHLGFDIQLYLQPVETNIYFSAYNLVGEEIVIYPSTARDPYVETDLFVGVCYSGISESVILGMEE